MSDIVTGLINPKVGTRQYPNMGRASLPAPGYDIGMALDPEKIGRQLRAKRGNRPQDEIEEVTGVSQTSIDRIEKGQWKKLSEAVVTLARYFSVSLPGVRFDEHIESSEIAHNGVRSAPSAGIPELETRAGLGGGGAVSIEVQAGTVSADPVKPDQWHFPRGFIRDELRALPAGLVILETQGDSMSPTLFPGERVFVDTNHRRPSPDGVYALRDQFGGLVVKRLHALAKKGRFSVISDNPAHPPKEVSAADLEADVLGRVVGSIRRL